jgi:quinol monooxygenase YgiN
MFAVMYRWRLKPGTESQFASAWAERTRAIASQEGGLGSRLHRSDDGWFVAYAQWPSRAAWEAFMAKSAAPTPAGTLMGSCIETREVPLCLEVVADLLALDSPVQTHS